MTVFVLGNGGDNKAIIGIAVGVSVGLLCIAAVVIVIAILIYCYKIKNRYTKFHEFHTDYDTRFLISTSCYRSFNA